MQSRVLGDMMGELVVDKAENRIMTISGKLVEDVTIGWGLLGRLHQGGTFRVERRQVAPGYWQITETHVHIEGKALFFKNIGQQQDEVQTEFTQVPDGTTLEQAAEMSKSLK
jgi:predicted metalloprotease with PDZ domain